MDKQGKKILKEIEQIIKNDLSQSEAVELLSKFKAEEYDYLINLFENTNFSTIDYKTKEKLLIILKRLQEKLS